MIMTRSSIQLFHILVISLLFIYVGTQRSLIPKWLYNILFGVGIFIIVYHLYRAYLKYAEGTLPWVNFIHFFYIGPLLVYIGYKQDKTERYFYEILLIMGFGALGYHSYNYLIQPDSKNELNDGELNNTN